MKDKYPEGTKFGAFFMAKELGILVIRQRVILPDGRVLQPRHPQNKYKNITNRGDLQRYIDRLNGRQNRRVIREIETKLAFLPTELMEEFRETLASEIPNQRDARSHYRNLHRYFLAFFVDRLKLKDPLEWKANEVKWGMALLHDVKEELQIFEKKMSVKTIRSVIQVSNRFMAYLHKKMPAEIPFIKIAPISKARFKDYAAKLKMQDTDPIGRFMSESDWKRIERKLPTEIAPFVKMAYYYGLRRSETLGLLPEQVRNAYLSVERQLESISGEDMIFKPLKNKTQRKTPHWFLGAEDAQGLIIEMQDHMMHPQTLGNAFMNLMAELGMPYEMRDLRRTFITRALREHNHVDVQHAVGHGDLRTTMRYQQDDRNLDDTVFVPKKLKSI